MMNVYGLKNCDTCRKATAWLDELGVEHVFHDVRKEPLDEKTLLTWLKELGSTTLVNRRGTTWRELSPEQQAKAASVPDACALILEHPALMKRPVFDLGTERLVGFGEDQRRAINKP
jgi:arsenate reductase (glutaredoxin)